MNGPADRNAGFPPVAFMPTVGLAGLLFFSCGCSGDLSTEVTIPNSAVQVGLDAWMPVVLNDYVDKDLPVSATLVKTEIVASDGSDRLGVKMHLKTVIHQLDANKVMEAIETEVANLAPPGFPETHAGHPSISKAPQRKPDDGEIVDEIRGTVTTRVGIRYEASTAKFYCQDAKAEEIIFDKMPSHLEEPIKRLCEEALNKYFAENSLYTLSGDNTTITLAKSALKNVSVRDGRIVVELGLLP